MTDEELAKRASELMRVTNGLHNDLVNVVEGYCDQRQSLRKTVRDLNREIDRLKAALETTQSHRDKLASEVKVVAEFLVWVILGSAAVGLIFGLGIGYYLL